MLELDDTLLGFSYSFTKGSRFVCYLHSFDEDYRRFGAGNLLDYYMTIQRYEEGIDIANAVGKSMWQRNALLGKCVEITKKSSKIVSFKRNTLWKTNYWLRNYRELQEYAQHHIFTTDVELYRLPARSI